jgi:hypothetical protein
MIVSKHDILRALTALCVTTGLVGCSSWQQTAPKEQSLLKPISAADDGVQLEIVSVRFPFGDEELNDSMWNDIDEQQLPLSVRQKLAEAGLRAGVAGGQLPAALARMMAAADQGPANAIAAAASLEQAPPVSRQQMQLHSGWHGEIISSTTYPQLSLLTREDGGLSGQTYSAAQGVLQAKAEALGDRRIRLSIVPELQYGQVRQQWTVEDGRLVGQQGKSKRVFDHLAFEAALAPGEMLVLTSLPQRSGTLGHYLFTEPHDDQLQQKLLIVRLADTHYSDLFASPSLADADGSSQRQVISTGHQP